MVFILHSQFSTNFTASKTIFMSIIITKLQELNFSKPQIRLLKELELWEKIEEILSQNNPETTKPQILSLIKEQTQLLKKQKSTLAKIDPEVIKWRKSLNLLTDKPILRLANIITDGQNLAHLSDFELDILLEKEALEMSNEERLEFGLPESTGLSKMIQVCYQKLNLATFLTTGEMETRAWTFKNGSTAPTCAGVIHTDFTKKFVKAEVVSYEDFVACGGRKVAIEKGKLRSEGKEYVMKDGDVVEFKIAN